MANIIKIKQSAVPSKIPLAGDLHQGELALNTADEKLYTKNSSGVVIELGKTTGAGSGLSFSSSESQPISPNIGDTWYDPTDDKVHLWVGIKWMIIATGGGTIYTTYDGGDSYNAIYTETLDGEDSSTTLFDDAVDSGSSIQITQ